MKRWFLWNFTMLNTHAEILWISSILEYLELEINILFQWALVSSTRIFTGQLIRSMRKRFKISCQRAQNTIFSFAKYTRPWPLGNQIKSNSCDFNWGEGDLDKYQEKFYDCAGEIMNFTFQQQLLDEISMKQIHWLSSFQRTFEAQLDPLLVLGDREDYTYTLDKSRSCLHASLPSEWAMDLKLFITVFSLTSKSKWMG